MFKIILFSLAGVLILAVLYGYINSQNKKQNKMKVTVWDTYVKKKDGTVMHFDIVAPETETDTGVIHKYGKEYLTSKGQEGQPLSAKECRRCHVRDIQPQWEEDIKKQGYFIIEMENCTE